MKLATDCLPCWRWARSDKGYGNLQRANKRTSAHRIAWEDANQACLLPGALIMHQCDNPSCINPKHLRLGSPLENMQDMHRKGRCRAPRGATHPHAKLVSADVLRMREWAALGTSTYALARWFGVSQMTVSRILRRASWAWLDTGSPQHVVLRAK